MRACHWITSAPPFLDLHNSWDFPQNFTGGLNEKALESEIAELTGRLENSPLRMGRIFERLFFILFRCHDEYEVLEEGVGIFNEERQVTELDILLRTPEGRGLHLEAAVKFYLYLKDGDEIRVVGPNGNDVLENRMSKFDRQLKAGKEYVKSTYPDLEFDHCVFTRGRIFQLADGKRYSHPLIHPNAETGQWCKGIPNEQLHRMMSRWEWIAWPPKYSESLEKPVEVQHAWKETDDSYEHWIILPE